jgi:hypothetical protein
LNPGGLGGFAREILFIYSRKGAEPQRNCGPSKKESPFSPYKGELTLVLPQKFRGVNLKSRKGLSSASVDSLRLGIFARHILFFLFFSRKSAETQRNCGPLGLTA